ncbi:hypothetical protein KP509_20G047600 [Ceratopteris richardii]|nr:hypothetical protein KP509_20G047600 [Ceratopteris richardii]
MTRIRNCTGLTLELRCRHPKGDPKGASVFLKDGDSIDDSMGAFDAVSLEGEGKKALTSFALGDSLLSVRPAKRVPMSALRVVDADHEGFEFVWSEDIKGAKQIRSSGLLKKLKYKFRKSLRGQNTLFSFSMIFCGISDRDICREVETQKGVHILIQTSSRVVPLMSSDSLNESDTNKSVIAFKKQEEIVLLPTLCIQNFLDTKISVLATCSTGKSSLNGNTAIERGCRISFYADPAEFVFTVHLDEHNLTSNNVSIGEWDKKIERCTVPADYMNGLHKELNFGNSWCARLKMLHNDDGVLQILVFSQFAAKNSSNIPLLVCVPKNSGYSWSFWNRPNKMHFPQDEAPVTLNPGTTMSLFRRSSYILFKLAEGSSEIAILDLESFSGSTELSLKTPHADGSIEVIQLGVRIETTSSGSKDPTRLINISSRYIISNESDEIIYVCQDGLQEDENSAKALEAGQNVSLTAQFYPGQRGSSVEHTQFVGSATSDSSFFSIRFRFFQNCWDWTGPVCASAIGSFCLRVHRRMDYIDSAPFDIQTKDAEMFKFVAVEVEEKSPSLIIHFHKQTADAVPYRIENALSKASIFFHQKGVDDIVTTLEAGKRTGYAWDNLSQPHKLIISVSGTQLQIEVKLDKLVSWKPVRASKKNAFRLLFAFDNQLATSGAVDGSSANVQTIDPMKVGYEIVADGFQRVLRISEDRIVSKLAKWQSHLSLPSTRFDLRIPVFSIALVECLQYNDARTISSPKDDNQLPFIVSIRMGNLFFEILNTKEHCLFQLKVETLSVDERWEGAPFSAMLRVHTEDRFKRGETVLQMATVISNLSSDPVHVNYTSILLQTIDLNLDEETLMKLVPFYRLSLRDSKSSIQIYFERLEIHPIKIIASFLPGQPMPDYNSTQETFRTLLHSFIEVPSIRGFTVELNGVLLTHALLTFRQLAIKCAQHYSWYAMRAVYIAKGSKLLPPAFTSLFDDSAASSLDVFFDPSRGTVDIQGLTLGMFNFLSNGLKKRGLSGTNRYIGDLEHTMKTAGSNILFAVLTEVSDNVLKGAETGGFDGMVNGFRRGILNVSMEPSLLRTAVMKGGSSRRIKLDHSAGTDEAYIEGYLQAMLDTLFQQSYLKVKVVDDQVLLKNMPPSSVLADEIMSSVRTFLISEGLLAGETSATAIRSRRRLHGENDKRIVPAVIALCEQLFVIFAVRALRNETRSWLSWGLDSSKIANSKLGNLIKKETGGKVEIGKEGEQKETRSYKGIMFSFIFSSAMAYMDGRLCRHIPNRLARRIVSGFLLSFVE